MKINKIEIELTEDDVENIIVTAFEGGINYWCGHVEWEHEKYPKPNGVPVSTYCAMLLNKGVALTLFDIEDESEIFELTYEKLLKGVELNLINRPFDSDLENMDVTTADCIIQYAVFGEIVYC